MNSASPIGAIAALVVGLAGACLILRASNRRWKPNAAKHIPISMETAAGIAKVMGVDTQRVRLDQFRRGLEIEQEHMDITGLDFEKIGKIALAHLAEDERPDYYDALDRMEAGGC